MSGAAIQTAFAQTADQDSDFTAGAHSLAFHHDRTDSENPTINDNM
jgi:hypothetical protein